MQVLDRRVNRPVERHRSGAALVEMALVLPIFCMIILGIIEFGRAFMVGQLLCDAAREGARSVILTGSTNTAVTSDAQTFVASTTKCPAADVTVAITVTEYTGNPPASNDLANARKRDLCRVKVSVPFGKVSFLPGTYLSGRTLSAESAMRHE